MRLKTLLAILAVAAFLGGCAGGKTPVSAGDARSKVDSLSSKKFEVSKVQLTVAPNPPEASDLTFNALAQPFMFGTMGQTFTDQLSILLKRDLGIDADYRQLHSTFNYKTSKKAGFVWDPDLYARQATKQFKTGKQTIEITAYVPNPSVAAIETLITVSGDGDVLKQYKIQAVMSPNVHNLMLHEKAKDYFIHIPELLSLGINGYIINEASAEESIADFKGMLERIRFQNNPPENDLKRLREMVTDIDPSSGIVLEEFVKPDEAQEKSGSGATLMD